MRSKVLGWASRRKAAVWGAFVLVFAMVGTAGATAGAMLHLGVVNTKHATTTLTGSISGPEMRITNNGTGPALALGVDTNRPALSVSSTARVPKLNADRLDGLEGAQLEEMQVIRRTHSTAQFTDGDNAWGTWFTTSVTVPAGKVLLVTGQATAVAPDTCSEGGAIRVMLGDDSLTGGWQSWHSSMAGESVSMRFGTLGALPSSTSAGTRTLTIQIWDSCFTTGRSGDWYFTSATLEFLVVG